MNQYIVLKVIVAGDKRTGKSTLTYRLSGREELVKREYENTIGVEFLVRFLHDKGLRVNFWDLAGDKKYEKITFPYFKAGNILLLVYSVDSYESLTRIQKMYKEYKERDIIKEHKVIVVCNKLDLISKNVELYIGSDWAKLIGADFISVSAKNDTNVDGLLKMILFMGNCGNVKLSVKEKEEKKGGYCHIF